MSSTRTTHTIGRGAGGRGWSLERHALRARDQVGLRALNDASAAGAIARPSGVGRPPPCRTRSSSLTARRRRRVSSDLIEAAADRVRDAVRRLVVGTVASRRRRGNGRVCGAGGRPPPDTEGKKRSLSRRSGAPTVPARLTTQQRDEVVALTLRQAADRLARRDAALREDLVDLHAPETRDGQQQVEDLRGFDVARRIHEQSVD